MSLYNLLMGVSPEYKIMLMMIGRVKGDFGRFRDVWFKNNKILVVYTRDGGDNRKCVRYFCADYWDPCGECTGCVMSHDVPTFDYYIDDKDDGYDITYAKIYFRIPEKYQTLAQKIIDNDVSYKLDPLYLELSK